jgi:hypothetical protein
MARSRLADLNRAHVLRQGHRTAHSALTGAGRSALRAKVARRVYQVYRAGDDLIGQYRDAEIERHLRRLGSEMAS